MTGLSDSTATSDNTAGTVVKRDGSGNFSAGTITATGLETGTLKVTGGTPANGKVLTSDASGNASWQTLSGSSQWTTSGSDISFSSGKVSIGTATAGQTLTVNGRIETKGGMLFNQGSGAMDNLIYLGSTSSGPVDASLGFLAGGIGSSGATEGPYFLARGSAFSTIANQRGNIYFSAGLPSGAAGTATEGSINFYTSDKHIMMLDAAGRFMFRMNESIGSNYPTSGFDVRLNGSYASFEDSQSGAEAFPLVLRNSGASANGTETTMHFKMSTDGSSNISFAKIGAIVTDKSFPASYGDLYFSTVEAGALAEKMRLTSAGRLGILNNNPSTLLHVGSAATTTGTTVATFQNAGGTCSVTPNTAGAISCSSDERLKEKINSVSGEAALDLLLQLQAKTYQFRSDRSGARHTGYIAQELQKVAPEFVRKGEDGYLQVFYSGLIPWITEGIKELHSKLIGVDSRVRALEVENRAIQAESQRLRSESAQLKAYLCAKDPQALICGR